MCTSQTFHKFSPRELILCKIRKQIRKYEHHFSKQKRMVVDSRKKRKNYQNIQKTWSYLLKHLQVTGYDT